jgi:hypothetical protein
MPSRSIYRHSSFTASDSDVALIVYLAIECIDEAGYSPDSWYGAVESAWRRAVDASGYGLLDLRLDYLVTNEEQARQMIALLRKTGARAESFSPAFPREWLNRVMPAAIYYYQDYPVQPIVEIIGRLIALFERL